MSQPNRRNINHVHTPVTTGFRCQICDGLFAKHYLLRTHERKCHGVVQTSKDLETSKVGTNLLRPAPRVMKLIIPALQTAAMGVAKSRGEIPFAVLHMREEIPLLVRVIDEGEYSILKAAENSDFRESQRGGAGLTAGSSVSIAVVATIYQRLADDGKSYYEITGPVSCFQTKMAPTDEQPEEAQNDVLQDSLASGDMHKTLTQLNAPVIETRIVSRPVLLPALRPHQVQPSVPAATKPKGQKRTKATRVQTLPAKQYSRAQPKVVTVIDGVQQWWEDQNTASSAPQRSRPINYRDMVTGPLLSPARRSTVTVSPPEIIEVPSADQQDPFANLDMLDLIRVEDGVLSVDELSGDIEVVLPPI